MLLQNWWYTTLLGSEDPIRPPLVGDVKTDVVVVGAGMAGLMAAQRLAESGSRVVLLDRNICGGSTTGKSAGFLTPDSELELSQILRRFGRDGAHHLWQVPEKGIELIARNVKDHGISCDFRKQDSLFVANDKDGSEEVHQEAEARRLLGYPYTEYPGVAVSTVLGSPYYHGAVRYDGCYGIDALRYSQGMKRILLDRGVQIYESTEARAIDGHTVRTHGGSISADSIIVCSDKLKPAFTHYADNAFHAQTFLAISEPLTDREAAALFPGDPLQCWDTDLVYSYWRLTGQQRILLGGGSALTTYSTGAVTSPRVIHRVIERFRRKFPAVGHVQFLQYWPGLIDMTRDLFPTVLRDPEAPWVHYVLGCVGLPWAAFCGDFAARHTQDSKAQEDEIYYQYFRPDRPFLLPLWSERLLGKPIVFSLNNVWAKYYQK